MSGSPAKSWSGLLGRRVEPRRAGMTPRTRITKSNRMGGASQNACRAGTGVLWRYRQTSYGAGEASLDRGEPLTRRREEVAEDALAVDGADGLGVELDP